MSSELDYWRQFLQTANYDIFKTIEHAIHVAATDYPDQFEKKKEHLMHIISTVLSNKVLQSIASEHKHNTQLNDKKDKGKQVEIVNAERWTSEDDDEDDENVGIRDWLNKKSEKKQRKRKGKNVVTDNRITKKTSWSGREVHTETGSGSSMNNVISTAFTVNNGCAANLVAKEVEVESDVLTKENDVLGDVTKIRDALLQLKGQPVIAYELLMRLEKMNISAHVLQVTEIAAIVSFFANNDCSDSTHTRMLASSLLESWSIILDKWIEHANNARVVAETDKITVATDIVEPKSSIEAAKRTGPIQFIKSSSRPQSSQPIFDIGSRGSAINARYVVAGQQAERYKNRQLASSSQVQIGGSSRVNNYTTLKGQPKAELQGPKLIATEVPVLAKKIEEDPVRESLNIARKKLQEMLQNHKPDAKCTVACQPDETHHIKHKQLMSGSQVQIGGSSKANNYTSIKSQPRSSLQGPKLTVKDTLDAKNKMEVPAPIEKIEEDPVQESMKLAKRKFQEMQKSEQAKRHNMGLQSVNLAKRYNFVQRTPLPDPPQTYVRTLNDAYGSFVQLPKEGIILADELTPPEKTVSLVRTTTATTTHARRPLVSDDTLDQLGTDFRTLHDHIMSEQELRSNYNIYINPGLLAHDGAQILLGFSDIKDLMTWRWLTESIIQVWILYLITLSERDGISVGFMDPSKINQVALDKNNDDAVSYMANAMITFMDRKFILAPYYQNKHWVLLVIQPRDCMVYVLDTKIPEEGTKYVITRPFQTAFQSYVKLGGEYNGRKGEKVSWKFAKCPQQPKNWECGYYIMKLMHDLITTWHSLWPNCALSRRALPMTDLHQIRLQWVKFLLGKIDN